MCRSSFEAGGPCHPFIKKLKVILPLTLQLYAFFSSKRLTRWTGKCDRFNIGQHLHAAVPSGRLTASNRRPVFISFVIASTSLFHQDISLLQGRAPQTLAGPCLCSTALISLQLHPIVGC